MEQNLRNIATFLLDGVTEITRDVLEEKLQEAYGQGVNDGFRNRIDNTLDNIRGNTMLEIQKRKRVLYENNFYNKPAEEAVVEMKALEYLEKHIPEIIAIYRES